MGLVYGKRVPARLEGLVARMPEDVAKALGAVDVVARALCAEEYEAKAATARRQRDWTLAKGYSAIADEVLSSPAPESTEDVAELLAKADAVGGQLAVGYRQRAAMATAGRPEYEFRGAAESLLRAERGLTITKGGRR